MRNILSLAHLSLDGVMQSPGGPQEDPRGGFNQGGWAMHHGDDISGAALQELIAGEFDLLLGRRTYEIFAAYWPYHQDNSIGRAFNRARKFVVTRSLTRLDWVHSTIIGRDPINELRALKASDGPDLHIWGSGVLMQTLMGAGLIDEFRIWMYPVVLGGGRRLFEAGVPAGGLSLIESVRTTKGVLLNTYRPTGPLTSYKPDQAEPNAAEIARRQKLAEETSNP